MPSYRYTRDISPEDLHPAEGPALSPKEQRKNWWHYHWKIVVAILAAVALVAAFILEIVRKDTPDLTVGVLTTSDLPGTVTELLEARLGELVGDVNGDGKVVVEISVFTVTVSDEEEEGLPEDVAEAALEADAAQEELEYEYTDPYTQMAGITRLSAALGDDVTMLYLVQTEMLEQYIEHYGILGYLDGTPAEEGATDYENIAFAWEDSPVLSGFDMMVEYEGGSFDAQEYMGFFSVGLRQIAGGRVENDETALENWNLARELIADWRA